MHHLVRVSRCSNICWQGDRFWRQLGWLVINHLALGTAWEPLIFCGMSPASVLIATAHELLPQNMSCTMSNTCQTYRFSSSADLFSNWVLLVLCQIQCSVTDWNWFVSIIEACQTSRRSAEQDRLVRYEKLSLCGTRRRYKAEEHMTQPWIICMLQFEINKSYQEYEWHMMDCQDILAWHVSQSLRYMKEFLYSWYKSGAQHVYENCCTSLSNSPEDFTNVIF